MARRRRADKRQVEPDPQYHSLLVSRMISKIMRRGKKSVAQGIVYGALEQIREQSKEDPLKVLETALNNVKPQLEVKSRRVGGATYQVPIEVSYDRQISLALRWVVQFAETRKGLPMKKALAMELMDAFNNQGNAIKKREDTHKMAQANKAFAHYRW
ncbi:MAG: 30S ribosomal protein S7 [Kiritimatiellae bacterium]|nr:30S ribosomal protein S7 [Kiritimatiellia bacterium]